MLKKYYGLLLEYAISKTGASRTLLYKILGHPSKKLKASEFEICSRVSTTPELEVTCINKMGRAFNIARVLAIDVPVFCDDVAAVLEANQVLGADAVPAVPPKLAAVKVAIARCETFSFNSVAAAVTRLFVLALILVGLVSVCSITHSEVDVFEDFDV